MFLYLYVVILLCKKCNIWTEEENQEHVYTFAREKTGMNISKSICSLLTYLNVSFEREERMRREGISEGGG